MLELVKLGLGWAAVPDFLLHRPLARGEVVVLKPDFITQPELALELQWHRARPLGQAGRWLKEALLARARWQGAWLRLLGQRMGGLQGQAWAFFLLEPEAGVGLGVLGQHGGEPQLAILLPGVEHHAAAAPVVTELDLQGVTAGNRRSGGATQHEQGAVVGTTILGAGHRLLPHVAALGEADAVQRLQVEHLGMYSP